MTRRIVTTATSNGPVAPGAESRVREKPGRPVPLTVLRLAIPRDVADHFEVVDIEVAGQSQFRGTGPLPAQAFSPSLCDRCHEELLPRTDLLFRTAAVGEDIVVVVRNMSPLARPFRSALIGITE